VAASFHDKLLGWPRLVQDDLSLGMETGDRPIARFGCSCSSRGSVYFLMNDLVARRFGHNEFGVQVT
jgi:hypothetical protein